MPSVKRLRFALVATLLVSATIASAQTISYFKVSGDAQAIAAGPDGNLWFTSSEGIGRITPLGELTTFPTPSGARSITAGPRNLMWFTRSGGISAIDTKGTVVKYDIPLAEPYRLTAGPGDYLWFSFSKGIGRLTALGAVTLFPLPLKKADDRIPEVLDMTVAADGNVWFVEW